MIRILGENVLSEIPDTLIGKYILYDWQFQVRDPGHVTEFVFY